MIATAEVQVIRAQAVRAAQAPTGVILSDIIYWNGQAYKWQSTPPVVIAGQRVGIWGDMKNTSAVYTQRMRVDAKLQTPSGKIEETAGQTEILLPGKFRSWEFYWTLSEIGTYWVEFVLYGEVA